VRVLMQDVTRLSDRVSNLDKHFRSVTKDVEEITTSTGKILKHGEKIEKVDFETVADRPLLAVD
jgi:DNA recombination protein RmuC